MFFSKVAKVLVYKLLRHGLAEDRFCCRSCVDEDVCEKTWVTECYKWRTLFLIEFNNNRSPPFSEFSSLPRCSEQWNMYLLRNSFSRNAAGMVICKLKGPTKKRHQYELFGPESEHTHQIILSTSNGFEVVLKTNAFVFCSGALY